MSRWSATSTPSKRTHPASAGCTPARASSSVVLPAPLAPTIATSSPGSNEKDTSCRTCVPRGVVLVRPATSTRTPVAAPGWRWGGTVSGDVTEVRRVMALQSRTSRRCEDDSPNRATSQQWALALVLRPGGRLMAGGLAGQLVEKPPAKTRDRRGSCEREQVLTGAAVLVDFFEQVGKMLRSRSH